MMPDAPMVIEYAGAVSHTPTPEITQTMPVTTRNRRAISSRNPSTRPGAEIAEQAQSPCRNGDQIIPVESAHLPGFDAVGIQIVVRGQVVDHFDRDEPAAIAIMVIADVSQRARFAWLFTPRPASDGSRVVPRC